MKTVFIQILCVLQVTESQYDYNIQALQSSDSSESQYDYEDSRIYQRYKSYNEGRRTYTHGRNKNGKSKKCKCSCDNCRNLKPCCSSVCTNCISKPKYVIVPYPVPLYIPVSGATTTTTGLSTTTLTTTTSTTTTTTKAEPKTTEPETTERGTTYPDTTIPDKTDPDANESEDTPKTMSTFGPTIDVRVPLKKKIKCPNTTRCVSKKWVKHKKLQIRPTIQHLTRYTAKKSGGETIMKNKKDSRRSDSTSFGIIPIPNEIMKKFFPQLQDIHNSEETIDKDIL